MVVVARALLYDVADPIHPRLVCRASNTGMHLRDGNSIAYTTVVSKHVVIVRRDLTTGVETRVAQLRVAPTPYYFYGATWSWDGSVEVYSTSGAPNANGSVSVKVHLWSQGADHVLYTIASGAGGVESRWTFGPMLELSPDQSYVAISDHTFSITNGNLRIFSVADWRQKLVNGNSVSGGTWVANDRFVWAAGTGYLMQWTPTGGVKLLRSEHWYGVTSSSDGKWIAGTLLADVFAPRVFIAPMGTGRTFRTGLASNPEFVTPTVVWYGVEKLSANGYDPTAPTGAFHALDVVHQTDKLVTFRAGESP